MKISIVTPSLNPGKQIETAAASIDDACEILFTKLQYIDVEHIIVDNGSLDYDTKRAYARILNQKRPCKTFLLDSVKRGASVARNVGVQAATGDWLAFLDADDRFIPESFAALVVLAYQNPAPGWIIADAEAFYENGSHERKIFMGALPPTRESATSYVIPQTRAMRIMSGSTTCFLGAMLLKKELLPIPETFNESFVCGEDWFLNLNLASYSAFRYVPMTVLSFRRGHTSLTQDPSTMGVHILRARFKALLDPRFKSTRRILRWGLVSQITHIRNYTACHGMRLKAFRYGVLVWLVAPENIRSLFLAIKCLRGWPGKN